MHKKKKIFLQIFSTKSPRSVDIQTQLKYNDINIKKLVVVFVRGGVTTAS